MAAALGELRRAAAAAPGLPLVAHLAGLGEWAEEVGGGEEATRERREHVDALVRLGHDYLDADLAYPGNSPRPPADGTAAGFVAYLVTVLAEDTVLPGEGPGPPGTRSDAVELLTFHKAKGLEWPVVFVTGLERGLVPIAYAETPAALAEERRLLYVALTRAERELHLSWAQRRTLGGREMSRQASPYLTSIEAALAAFGPDGDGDWQSAIAAERARLASARAAARPGTDDGRRVGRPPGAGRAGGLAQDARPSVGCPRPGDLPRLDAGRGGRSPPRRPGRR